jgi:hypothetical protein
LDFIMTSHSVAADPQAFRDFAQIYQSHLRPHFTEPRAIKRYFGQVEAYWPLVSGEVHFVDFLMVTFLRTFYPEAYRLLASKKSDLTATLESVFGPKREKSEVLDEWHRVLKSHAVPEEEVQSVLAILGHLFVPISDALGPMSGADYMYEQMYRDKRVGSPDYFDRYFQFGVPPSDLSDALVAQAAAELREGAPSTAVHELTAYVGSKGDQVVSKLMVHVEAFTPHQKSLVLRYLAKIFSALGGPETESLMGAFAPQDRAAVWAGTLLNSADLDNLDVALFVRERDGPRLLVNALYHAYAPGRDTGAADWSLDAFVERAADALRARLEGIFDLSLDEADDDIWILAEIATMERSGNTKEWFRSNEAKAKWHKEELLGVFVGVSVSYGTELKKRVSSFSRKHFDALIGLDRLNEYLPSGSPPNGDEFDQADVAVANRAKRAWIELWDASTGSNGGSVSVAQGSEDSSAMQRPNSD